VTATVSDAYTTESEGPTAPPINNFRLGVFRRARAALAGLIGAGQDEISIQQNTTEGINIILSGLGLGPQDEVISCSLEHSSVVVPAYYARERAGAGLKFVRISAADSSEEIVRKFEEVATPARSLIVVSHMSYATGQVLPVRELAQIAHRNGGYLLLDTAQSVGQMPVDVRDLDCDFCAFPGHKWLLGPAATGALYIKRELIERVEPPKTAHHAAGYYNFKDRFEAKSDTIDKFETTAVSVPLLAGLNAAIEFVGGLGLDTIYERALHLGRYATGRLRRIAGVRMISAENEERVQSGLVSFAVAGVEPAIVTACLWERARVVVRTVPDAGCTRLSLHVFNTEAEIDAAVAVVAELARDGAPEGDYPSIKLESDTMMEL